MENLHLIESLMLGFLHLSNCFVTIIITTKASTSRSDLLRQSIVTINFAMKLDFSVPMAELF